MVSSEGNAVCVFRMDANANTLVCTFRRRNLAAREDALQFAEILFQEVQDARITIIIFDVSEVRYLCAEYQKIFRKLRAHFIRSAQGARRILFAGMTTSLREVFRHYYKPDEEDLFVSVEEIDKEVPISKRVA